MRRAVSTSVPWASGDGDAMPVGTETVASAGDTAATRQRRTCTPRGPEGPFALARAGAGAAPLPLDRLWTRPAGGGLLGGGPCGCVSAPRRSVGQESFGRAGLAPFMRPFSLEGRDRGWKQTQSEWGRLSRAVAPPRAVRLALHSVPHPAAVAHLMHQLLQARIEPVGEERRSSPIVGGVRLRARIRMGYGNMGGKG